MARIVPSWLQPSLLGVWLAGVAEAAMVALRYRSEVSGGQFWTELTFYWPWYVHAHGDNVTAADPLLFALNVLTGVALFLPVAHALELLLAGGVGWAPFREPARDILRPGLAKTALTFPVVVLGSVAGLGISLNLLALPGTLLLVGGLVASRAVFGGAPDLSAAIAVPYALGLGFAWLLVSLLWERRLEGMVWSVVAPQ